MVVVKRDWSSCQTKFQRWLKLDEKVKFNIDLVDSNTFVAIPGSDDKVEIEKSKMRDETA
jgi:hypothetical protein